MLNLPANRPGLWLSILEVVTWVMFTVMLIIALVIRPLSTGPEVIVVYGAYVALMAYARSVSYLQIPVMPGQTHRRGERAAAFALVPLYGVLHVLLVLPLQIWAAATVHRGGWGTRSHVEVTITTTESLTALGTRQVPADPQTHSLLEK
jgi:hyaluronan synthase